MVELERLVFEIVVEEGKLVFIHNIILICCPLPYIVKKFLQLFAFTTDTHINKLKIMYFIIYYIFLITYI